MRLRVSLWWTGIVWHNCYGDATDRVKAVGLMSNSRWWRERWINCRWCFLAVNKARLFSERRSISTNESMPLLSTVVPLSRHLGFASSLSRRFIWLVISLFFLYLALSESWFDVICLYSYTCLLCYTHVLYEVCWHSLLRDDQITF